MRMPPNRYLTFVGPIMIVVGQQLPQERRTPRLLLLSLGGAATLIGLWDRLRSES